VQYTKAYVGVEVQVHVVLKSALDEKRFSVKK
jgi:hypothetical protein